MVQPDASERSYQNAMYKERVECVDREIRRYYREKKREVTEDEFLRNARYTQYYLLLDRMAKKAGEYAVEKKVPVDDFASGILDEAMNVCDDIKRALDPNVNASDAPYLIWRHVSNITHHVVKDDDLPLIDRQQLHHVTGRYLDLPFREEMIDRILVDTLVVVELIAYGKEMVTKPPKNSYFPSRSPLHKPHVLRQYFVGLFSNLLVFCGPAALLIWLGLKETTGTWSFWAAAGLAVLFLLCCVLQIVSLPFAWRQQTKARTLTVDLLKAMVITYDELAAEGPASANRIYDLAADAAKLGVVWPPPLFALLDDVKRRTGRL